MSFERTAAMILLRCCGVTWSKAQAPLERRAVASLAPSISAAMARSLIRLATRRSSTLSTSGRPPTRA